MLEGRKILGMILLVFVVSLGFYKPLQEYVKIPKQLVIFEGHQETFATAIPVSKIETNSKILEVNQEQATVNALEQGDANMTVKLSGAPSKYVDVKVL